MQAHALWELIAFRSKSYLLTVAITKLSGVGSIFGQLYALAAIARRRTKTVSA
jgi:hypothetical protein